jgi:hypothetical protein
MTSDGLTFLTKERREQFLDALRQGCSVSLAARQAGFSRQAAYAARKVDPQFGEAWDDAIETGTDRLEDVAALRAAASSDALLIFLLKGRRPEKFSDRHSLSLGGQPEAPLVFSFQVDGGEAKNPAAP